MDILQYLLLLLKDQTKVGFENFGTFLKTKKPGRYDAATHSFLPPSYALNFQNEVTENAVLVEYIQAERGISADSANYFIQQFVEDLQKELAENGEAHLPALGTFKLNGDKYSFTEDPEFKFENEFFALPSVTLATPVANEVEDVVEAVETPEAQPQQPEEPTVQIEEDAEQPEEESVVVEQEVIPVEIEQVVAPDFAAEAILNTESPVVEEETPIVEAPKAPLVVDEIPTIARTEEFEERQPVNVYENKFITPETNETEDISEVENNGRKRYSNGLIWTLIFIVIALLGLTAYLLYPKYFKVAKEEENEAYVDRDVKNLKSLEDSLSFADSIMHTAQKVGLEVKPAKDTIKVTTVVKPQAATTYHIVGAAFARESEANEYITLMRAKGFKAKIVGAPGKKYRNVSIASYEHPDSAEKYLEIYRTQFNNTTFYVKPVKN